jgi:hypothetical protein
MNGATEATLAELLRVAQTTNVNIEKLTSLMGGGGGGGSNVVSNTFGTLGKSSGIVSLAFNALSAAASLVGKAFEMIGNIVGKTVTGFVELGKGIFNFAKAAEQGTATLSTLFESFSKLPFFIGEVSSLFAGIISYSERLLDTFIDLSKSGAAFGGNLFEMRNMAAQAGMNLADFAKVVVKNSEFFSSSGNSVQSGIMSFVNANRALTGPGSKYAQGIFDLGVTAQEASEYLITVMKGQGSLGKLQKADADTMAKMTKEYVTELDLLSKITGKRREQIDAEVQAAQADQVWQLFLDSLSPTEAKAALDALATAQAIGGKDLVDVVKAQLRGVDAPLTEAATRIAVASQGMSVQQGAALRRIMADSTLTAEQRTSQLMTVFGKTAQSVVRFADMLGTQGQAVLSADIPQQFLQFGRQLNAAGGDVEVMRENARRQQAQQEKGLAGQLINAKKQIDNFGNMLTNLITLALGPLTTVLTEWGNKIIGWMTNTTNDLTPLMKRAIEVFNTDIVPVLEKIGNWFGRSFEYLITGDPTKTFWQRLGVVFKDGWNIIWKEIKDMWIAIKPEILRVWKDDIKPALIKLWEELLPALLNAIKTALVGPEITQDNRAKYEFDDKRNKSVMTAAERASTAAAEAIEASMRLINAEQADRMRAARIDRDTQFGLRDGRLILGRSGEVIASPTPRASGGRIDTGKLYSVGEKGTELANFGSPGEVISNDVLRQFMRTVADGNQNKDVVAALETLNNTMRNISASSRETAEYTKRTVSEVSSLNGNIMPVI